MSAHFPDEPSAVLAISSHVAVGHVGNAAAGPALERMGHPVWRVDTVSFSNHPGHVEGFTGRVRPADEVDTLLRGIAQLTGWQGCGGVYTGYMGEAETPAAIASHLDAAKTACPHLRVLCDPVIGDHGRVFVRDGVAEGILSHLIPRADIITPNAFELSLLTGLPTDTVEQAGAAAMAARALGPEIVVATGIADPDDGGGKLAIVMATEDGMEVVRQIRHDRPFFGTGDLFSGLFLGHMMATGEPGLALRRAAAGLAVATEVTLQADRVDLDLIPNLDRIVSAR
jgi:pyridoxine kinase